MKLPFLLVLVCGLTLANAGSCSKHSCSEDGYYPEGSCSPDFCQCEGGTGHKMTCMEGLYFNPEILVCDWMENVSTCKDRKLHATCDNQMKVYFDGELQEEDDAMRDWRKTSELTIPAGTRVVAIECQDLGAQEGILASAEGGLLTSSLSWECATEPVAGWTMPGFVAPQDTFATAKGLGTHGVRPWGVRPGISEEAEWIWPGGDSTFAACRTNL